MATPLCGALDRVYKPTENINWKSHLLNTLNIFPCVVALLPGKPWLRHCVGHWILAYQERKDNLEVIITHYSKNTHLYFVFQEKPKAKVKAKLTGKAA